MRLSAILLFSVLLFSLGCKKNGIERKKSNKNVLVYIAANNNLRNDAIASLDKIKSGFQENFGDLLVFFKIDSKNSYLLKILPNNKCDTIKKYSNENSSDPAFLNKVIQDSRTYYPAEKYGLVLWSHATGWLPGSKFTTKSFGYDRGYEIDIIDLANVLPKDFEFILFDACYMGSIEVCCQLKENAKYIIAS